MLKKNLDPLLHLTFYAPRFYPAVGGLEKVVRVWAEACTRMGHTVTVITQTPDKDHKPFPFPVLRRAGYWQQWRAMRQSDVVVQFDVSLKGLPLCLLSGRPLVISHHTAFYAPGADRPWRQRLKHWVSSRLASGNIGCSRFIAGSLPGAQVVYSPFEAAVFRPLHLPRPARSLLYVGRLVSIKGVDTLIEALAAMDRPATLTLVGGGPEQARLQQQVAALGISDRVHFAGPLPPEAVAREMNRHQVLVVPSREEPFGTVVAEGLACGCRVVTSNAGGLPEAGGGFTHIFPAGDAHALALVLQQVLELPPSPPPDPGLQAHLETLTVEHSARNFITAVGGMITDLQDGGSSGYGGGQFEDLKI